MIVRVLLSESLSRGDKTRKIYTKTSSVITRLPPVRASHDLDRSGWRTIRAGHDLGLLAHHARAAEGISAAVLWLVETELALVAIRRRGRQWRRRSSRRRRRPRFRRRRRPRCHRRRLTRLPRPRRPFDLLAGLASERRHRLIDGRSRQPLLQLLLPAPPDGCSVHAELPRQARVGDLRAVRSGRVARPRARPASTAPRRATREVGLRDFWLFRGVR